MRVLLTTQPGEGHWRPLAALGLALERAGHDVAFAATPVFCAAVERHGFAAYQVGEDDWLTRPSGQPPMADDSPVQAYAVLLSQFVPRAERNLPELLALCRSWQPDVIVREQTEFAGYLAAEKLGLPHAALQISAYRPHLEQQAAPALNRLRLEYGLPVDPELSSLHRHLFLLTFPPSYFDPSLPLPSTSTPIRLCSYDLGQPGAALPSWFPPDPTRPLVYATLGTAYSHTPGVLDAILMALRDEPINLIMTTTDVDASRFGSQPDNVHVERYIPQSLLLPHCDLVVTHGGSGTVRAALNHGLPMVIIPIAADQPDHARRCRALGLAEVIEPANRNPDVIRAAVRTVLGEPRYRRRTQAMQAELARMSGVDHGVALLEQLAGLD